MQVSIYDTKVTLGEEREAAILQKGIEKGIEKTKVDVVMGFYKEGLMDYELIARIVSISVDEVKKIIEENKGK